MKTLEPKRNSFFKNPAKSSSIPGYNSKSEFFCEGQECRSDEKRTNAKEEVTEVKEKKRDRFFGNFNMFF